MQLPNGLQRTALYCTAPWVLLCVPPVKQWCCTALAGFVACAGSLVQAGELHGAALAFTGLVTLVAAACWAVPSLHHCALLQVYICEQLGLKQVAEYWHSVVQINDYQKQRFVERMIEAMFNTISGKKIAILGFAFKKDTGDTRETPAIDVCTGLLRDKAHLNIFDPQVSLQHPAGCPALPRSRAAVCWHACRILLLLLQASLNATLLSKYTLLPRVGFKGPDLH